ncbi:MAG: HAD-IB family hydrolase [Nitrospirae bacterium]|nr:HAD-IB family hydrolase [Nitrospirota bacterium]
MIAAFFDVDNTIVHGPSLEQLFFRYLISKGVLKTRDIAGTLSFIVRCSVDLSGMAMRSRRIYLIGKPVPLIEQLADQCFEEVVRRRISRKARARIADHRKQGHRVVLITGSLDLLVRKVAQELNADDFIASDTERHEGHFTGKIRLPVPYGHGKGYWLTEYAERNSVNLSASFAYGDSPRDRWVFEQVGYPRVVNPGWRLRRMARQKGWEILRWD